MKRNSSRNWKKCCGRAREELKKEIGIEKEKNPDIDFEVKYADQQAGVITDEIYGDL